MNTKLQRISTLPFKLTNLPLWEEKFPESELRDICNQITEPAFNLGYRLEAASDKSLTFDADAVLKARDYKFDPTPEFMKTIDVLAFGIDLAISKRKKSDYSVITVGGLSCETNKRYLIDIYRDKHSATELTEVVVSLFLQYRPEIILVENNAMQQVMVEWLQINASVELPIEPYRTGSEIRDLDQGLPGLSVEFKNSMWSLPFQDHDPTDLEPCADNAECARCELIKELTAHPFGSHNDCCMSLWLLRQALNEFGGMPKVRSV